MPEPEDLDQEEEMQGTPLVDDFPDSATDNLAPVTPINPDMADPSPEADTVKPEFNFRESTLGKYLLEKQGVQLDMAKAIGRGFGRVGLRMLGTWQSDDLSIAEKVEGTLAGVVDAAGEVVKASLNMGSPATLLHLVPGEATGKATDAFINNAVDAASGIVAKREKDTAGKDIYRFNEEGIAQFTTPEGLATVGVEAAVGGVDGAMASVHESNQDSTSTAAEKFKDIYGVYDSKTGRAIKKVVTDAAVKHIHSKLGSAPKAA
jgi:hypothetical protein